MLQWLNAALCISMSVASGFCAVMAEVPPPPPPPPKKKKKKKPNQNKTTTTTKTNNNNLKTNKTNKKPTKQTTTTTTNKHKTTTKNCSKSKGEESAKFKAVTDITEYTLKHNWKWAGHTARTKGNRWTKRRTQFATKEREQIEGTTKRNCLLVGCLTSQQQASVSHGRICSDKSTSCHTEIDVADQTFYLTQSQYTDTGLTSPSADPMTPGAWQGSHWSVNFEVAGVTRPRKKSRRKRDSNPGPSALEADALTTRPTRRLPSGRWQDDIAKERTTWNRKAKMEDYGRH